MKTLEVRRRVSKAVAWFGLLIASLAFWLSARIHPDGPP